MQIGQTDNTTIHRVDEQGPGGAHHEYEIRTKDGAVLGRVSFQNGPIGENGVNGVQHADLLIVVRDRLDCFQRGPYASGVNEVTCGHVGAAIAADETRTRRRALAGVEGTSAKAAGVES
jgi:hypothetical protein